MPIISCRLQLTMVCLACLGCDPLTGRASNPYDCESGAFQAADTPPFHSVQYDGLWDNRAEPPMLMHLVLYPPGRTGLTTAMAMSSPPEPRGIHLRTDGLWLDGVRVPTRPGQRVFVHTQANILRPVSLTPAEEAALTPATVERLGGSILWRDKLWSVIVAERWKYQ